MKARPRFNFSKEQQKAIKEEVRKHVLIANQEFERDFDTVTIWVLHEMLGWGEKRITRLYRRMLHERTRLHKHYMSDEDADDTIELFAMRQKLKDHGIDITRILDEIEKETEND